jgi:hypothetical protein
MKSEIIEYTASFNNSRIVTHRISKDLLKHQYKEYLNKRRLNNKPTQEDLKLITFVRQIYNLQFIWSLERDVTDKLLKEIV